MNKYFSYFLISFSPLKIGLIEYSMNITSNFIRYFEKMVIFIKKK